MSESPADKARAEKILILTGTSIALSTIIAYFASGSPSFSFDFAPPLSLLTIIYHGTILILCRRHRNLPNASPYPTMRPSIGVAAFLLLVWLVTMVFMIVSLVLFDHPQWWSDRYVITLWAEFVLTVVETGCMLSLVVLCAQARRSLDAAAEREGRIQI